MELTTGTVILYYFTEKQDNGTLMRYHKEIAGKITEVTDTGVIFAPFGMRGYHVDMGRIVRIVKINVDE